MLQVFKKKQERMEKDFKTFNDKVNITPLLKGQEAFDQALVSAKNQLEQDGTIRRFKLIYELLWKTLKKIFTFKGISLNNPRDVFRQAYQDGLIGNIEFWFEVIKKRNLTSHVYSEQYATEIFNFLPKFQKELSKTINKIKLL